MAQTGLHALVGLGLSRALTGKRGADLTSSAGFGIVLGSILPDTDFFLAVPTFFIDSDLAMHMHRTFSHSLIVIAIAALVGCIAARSANGRALAIGIGVGMVGHSLLDILLWYSPVDLLWPLGLFGLPSTVNLWVGADPPKIVSVLLAAGDFGFFAIYFAYLAAKSKRLGLDKSHLPALRLLTGLVALGTLVLLLLGYTVSVSLFDMAHYGTFALLLLPAGLWATISMRDTIAANAPRAPQSD